MEDVFEYLYSVAVVGAVGSAACTFLPIGNEKTERFVRYILSLVVLLLLVSPLLNFFGSSDFFSEEGIKKATDHLVQEYESKSSGTREFIISDGIQNVQRRIGEAVARRYSVSAEDIEVVAETYDDGETVYINNIKITLGLSAFSLDADAVREYVSQLCGCECEVSFK